MPADLLRQAARRLQAATIIVAGVGIASLAFNALVSWAGWYEFTRPGFRIAILVALVAVSAGVAWWIQRGRPVPRSLLWVGVTYEILVAFAISLGEHLAPLPEQEPLSSVSWVCLWIALFPLVVPARTQWALRAGLASATTWPAAYGVGVLLGNPPAALEIFGMNLVEVYAAVAVSGLATQVVRRLEALGCYRLVRKLDQGGMGEIWEARHHMLARPVAIKLMRRSSAGSSWSRADIEKAMRRFDREAQATAALRSPHTVELHDFGISPEGDYYYVMELLEGLDLESLVERHGPLPPERVAHLLVQACDSLAEAHATGLIHRDIKPGNIFSCHVGRRWDFVKVLDFGLVKSSFSLPRELDGEGGGSLTAEGTITGTPAYIAPEVALGRPLDARVDLYGLGCVGYWLLTGERPFPGRTAMEIVSDHVRTPPVPPSERLGRPLPGDLEELVLACMAKQPEGRPASAERLASRLAECRFETPWTRERARAWWESRVGDAGGGPASLTGTASTPAFADPGPDGLQRTQDPPPDSP